MCFGVFGAQFTSNFERTSTAMGTYPVKGGFRQASELETQKERELARTNASRHVRSLLFLTSKAITRNARYSTPGSIAGDSSVVRGNRRHPM